MIEEFKDIVIPGYEGLYQVSNLGRVRSIKRKIFVKPNVDPAGYWKVCLTNHNHKWRQYAIHRLVASAFIPNPTGFPAVNHKDECKSNNCVDNLMWCTHRQNTNWGTCRSKISKAISKQVDQYTKDGTFVKRWKSMTEAAKALKLPISEISKCTRTTRYTSGGFHWRYVNERNQMA